MLSIFTSITIRERKGQEESFGGDGYVYFLDCNDRVTGLVICQNSSKGTQSFKHMQFFLHINYTSVKLLRLIFLQRLGRIFFCCFLSQSVKFVPK